MAPFGSARKGGKAAATAASRLGVAERQAKRARAAVAAGVDENGQPPAAGGAARKASRTARARSAESCLGACADTVAAAVGAAAATTPAPTSDDGAGALRGDSLAAR